MPFSLDAPAAVLPLDTTGFHVTDLFTVINEASANAKALITEVQHVNEAISIADMFAVQLAHNQLNLAELQSLVTSALNSNITSVARNIK